MEKVPESSGFQGRFLKDAKDLPKFSSMIYGRMSSPNEPCDHSMFTPRICFSDVSHTLECYSYSMFLDRWQEMIKKRFWSTFVHFSDPEWERACETIASIAKTVDQTRGIFV